MRKMRQFLAAGCAAALFMAGGAAAAMAAEVITMGEGQALERNTAPEDFQAPEFVPVWGPVIRTTEDRVYIDNISDNSSRGEIAITVSGEESRLLDAVNGYPIRPSDLQPGEMVYAYLGPAMTMSLPPIANGIVVISKAPADFKVPEYLRITESAMQADGSLILSGNNGRTYTIPADCTVLPYLTRNMVYIQDLVKDRTCLIWSDGDNRADKVVLFAPDTAAEESDTLQRY